MTTANRQLSQDVRSGITKRITQIAILFAFEAALLFLSAGRLDWWWAWAFLAVYVIGVAINATFMFRYSPETIARRSSGEGMRRWDRIVSGIWGLMGMTQLVVAGLDVRYGWTMPFPLLTNVIGGLLFALGFGLFSWAMISNAYFATVVRVQTERGHVVCTTGPYRFVRHPGYVGAILQSLALSLLLGSLWAFVPGIIAGLAMILRTALEDRTLQAELPGYAEYAQHVRHRLLPGIW